MEDWSLGADVGGGIRGGGSCAGDGGAQHAAGRSAEHGSGDETADEDSHWRERAAAESDQSAPPIYPALARQARIQGSVVLNAVIRTDGTVQEVRVISGHPLLVQAAEDAVLKWTYQPTLLNGMAVEVETTVTVNFVMDENPPAQQAPPAQESPAPGASDGEGTAGEGAPIDPQLKADILHLFGVMRMRERMRAAAEVFSDTLRPKLLASFPPTPNRAGIVDRCLEKYIAVRTSDDYLNRVAGIYAKYYSDEDIKAITKFYESPAGQRFNAVAPQVTKEVTQADEQTYVDGMARILKEMCAEFPELQGAANFCPKVAPGQGNQSLLREPESVPLSGAAQ